MKNIFVGIALAAMVGAAASAEPRPIAPMGRGLPAPEDRGAETAVEIAPRWDGNDIVAGSKRLSIQLNSKLALTDGGTTLFTMQYFGDAVSKATGKKLWTDPTYRFRENGGKMFREGNALVHERPFRLEDFAWDDAFRQRVELLPDGLVLIETTWTEPDNDLFAFHTYGAKWTIPYERAKEGGRFTANGEGVDLPTTPGKDYGVWRIKPYEKFEFSFFEEHEQILHASTRTKLDFKRRNLVGTFSSSGFKLAEELREVKFGMR